LVNEASSPSSLQIGAIKRLKDPIIEFAPKEKKNNHHPHK